MNKYITPTIDIIKIINTHIIMGSVNWGYCSRCCGMWHICRDRETGKRCEDYKYKS